MADELVAIRSEVVAMLAGKVREMVESGRPGARYVAAVIGFASTHDRGMDDEARAMVSAMTLAAHVPCVAALTAGELVDELADQAGPHVPPEWRPRPRRGRLTT